MKNYIDSLVVLGFVILAAFGVWKYTNYVQASATAPVSTAIIKAQAAAIKSEQAATERVTRTNENTRRQEVVDAERLRDIAAAQLRMRESAEVLSDTPTATAEALREYAQDLDRDFGECVEEYISLGDEAAGASRAAHALDSGYPALTEWDAAVAKFEQLAKDLK